MVIIMCLCSQKSEAKKIQFLLQKLHEYYETGQNKGAYLLMLI